MRGAKRDKWGNGRRYSGNSGLPNTASRRSSPTPGDQLRPKHLLVKRGIWRRGGICNPWTSNTPSNNPSKQAVHMGGQYLMSLGEAGIGRMLLISWGLNFLELSDVRLGVRIVCWTVLGLIKISPKLHEVIIK